MKQLFIFICILSIILAPAMALASPGSLDQYGGHICLKNCSVYGLTDGEYHYHDIPLCPLYLSGDIKKPFTPHLLFLPFIKAEEMTDKQISIMGNQEQLNELTQNPEIDARFCEGSEIFAKGWYDSLNRARIKPVCLNSESIVKSLPALTSASYFSEIPGLETQINKVYHVYYLPGGEKVYTDRPDISELTGKIIRAVTENTLYYVNRYDQPMTLRPVTPEKASFYGGADYAARTLYFDDSLIFSYLIGQPLY